MARGVADVLSLYLDSPVAPPPQTGESIRATRVETLAVPADLSGVVEPFLVWNLKVALALLGRDRILQREGAERAHATLLLLHASPAGLRRAERRLAHWPPTARLETVVYGEGADAESTTWVRRFCERYPSRRDALVHRGGVQTGRAFARSILRREAIARAQARSAVRGQLLGVAERLLQPEGSSGSS